MRPGIGSEAIASAPSPAARADDGERRVARLKEAGARPERRAAGGDAARLKLYRQLDRIGLPHSYAGKLVFIAALAYVPLTVLVVVLAFTPLPSAPRWGVLAAALVASALPIVALSRAVRALLAPVELSREALRRYLEDGERGLLPSQFGDELGALMRDVDQAIDRFDDYRARLEEYAAYDLLTGLLNRRAAEDRLRQTFSLAQRSHQPVVIAMLDLDHFKDINDLFGHGAGDMLLASVAAQLQASVRGADWVARWGGEEFLLLLHTDAPGAITALERLRFAVANVQVLYEDTTLFCTVSAGAAASRADESPAAVVQRADAALYQAKRAGRDCVRVAQEDGLTA